jgi:hypothetical protein
VNAGRLYASRQQYGASWHAAERIFFGQPKSPRSKQRCDYKLPGEVSLSGV